MFAYCLNNPVRLSDASGKYADDYFFDIGKKIGQWLYEIITTDENETDSNGNLTTNAKIKQTGQSVLRNAEFSAGVGLGLYSEGDVADVIGVSAGMYITNGSICYSDGQWQYGSEAYSGISGTVIGMEVGAAESGFRPLDGEWENEGWSLYNYTKPSMTIFSAAFFVGPGATVRIGFDHISFLHDISDIWGI
jgi:hypothetical protein